MLYMVQMLLHKELLFGCTDVICKPYCPDVIELCVRHRCYCACFGCTDVEEAKEDGSIPFLDAIIRPTADGTFTIGVYRKPTHTDLYLPWDSNHNIATKYSVINTLTHRVHTICSTPELAEKELQHLE